MKIEELIKILNAKIVSSNADLVEGKEIAKAFASDLMSDVLTLSEDNMLLITGLSNIQTIRTAEMADISVILMVRAKKISEEMIQLAEDSDIVLLECEYSVFKTCGLLYGAGLEPVY